MQITIEDGQQIPKGTKVRVLTAAPTIAHTIGWEGTVVGNMPNMLLLDGGRGVLKGWGTKKNPGRLTVEIVEG